VINFKHLKNVLSPANLRKFSYIFLVCDEFLALLHLRAKPLMSRYLTRECPFKGKLKMAAEFTEVCLGEKGWMIKGVGGGFEGRIDASSLSLRITDLWYVLKLKSNL
jgi:hypothetical protein